MQAQPPSNTAAKTSPLFRLFLLPELLTPESSNCNTGEGLC